MPANVQNARNFLLTTDYPIDIIVYLNSGSATVPSPSGGLQILVPHRFPFIPLVGGSWDITPSFNTNFDYSTGTIPSANPTAPFNVQLDISADATNVIIDTLNVSGSSAGIYYRIDALEPSDSHADIPFTASSGSPFILNTDNNYTKLFMEGVINAVTPSSTQSIIHNLGYRPQVSAWTTDFLGILRPVNLTSIIGGDPGNVAVKPTSTTVDFIIGSASNTVRIDYRIYIDETGNG